MAAEEVKRSRKSILTCQGFVIGYDRSLIKAAVLKNGIQVFIKICLLKNDDHEKKQLKYHLLSPKRIAAEEVSIALQTQHN